MKKLLIGLILIIVFSFVFVGPVEARVRVRGHMRRDGTWVQPHFRTSPNRVLRDNWSTRGNFNPFTGESGRVNPWRW